jgi:hypothetical protein
MHWYFCSTLLYFNFHSGYMESRCRVMTRFLRILETPVSNLNPKTGYTFSLVSPYPRIKCSYSVKSYIMTGSVTVLSNSQPIDHPVTT